jgi:hypothetical protein
MSVDVNNYRRFIVPSSVCQVSDSALSSRPWPTADKLTTLARYCGGSNGSDGGDGDDNDNDYNDDDEDNEAAVLPLRVVIIIAEVRPPVRWCGLSFQVFG